MRRKIFAGSGWVLFAVTLICMLVYAVPKNNTVDFRGYVTNISYNEAEKYVLMETVSVASDQLKAVVIVDDSIQIKDIAGSKFDRKKIKIGDMIDFDYKGRIGEDPYITAEWLSVYPMDA